MRLKTYLDNVLKSQSETQSGSFSYFATIKNQPQYPVLIYHKTRAT